LRRRIFALTNLLTMLSISGNLYNMGLNLDDKLRRLVAERDRVAAEGDAARAKAAAELADYVRQMHDAGITWAHIARVLGVSVQYVSRTYGNPR
jgi:DNA invertase Pin-like site-specific DNA recombinase